MERRGRSRATKLPVLGHRRQKVEAESEPAPTRAMANALPLRRGRIALPPPLFGSHESLVRQNEKTEAEGLERIQDDADLQDRIAKKLLVPIPVGEGLVVNLDLPENRRYCRPWTAKFLSTLAEVHRTRFHRPLLVTSAVRTVEYQKQLMRVNGNAASAEGDIASPHLTGGTIDIAKHGLTLGEVGWLRAWLLPLEQAGKIDVEEEFHQSCFHITVYKNFAPDTDAAKRTSAGGENGAAMLAAQGR